MDPAVAVRIATDLDMIAVAASFIVGICVLGVIVLAMKL
jgi:hypothetical protein